MDWGHVTAKRYEVSFWGNENVLKLTVVMTAQLCDILKNHWTAYSKWVKYKTPKKHEVLTEMCKKASPSEIFISGFSHVKTKTTVHKTSYTWMFKIALLAITMKAKNI